MPVVVQCLDIGGRGGMVEGGWSLVLTCMKLPCGFMRETYSGIHLEIISGRVVIKHNLKT
jgi:hypothetical protein